jgi:hypothetical protein
MIVHTSCSIFSVTGWNSMTYCNTGVIAHKNEGFFRFSSQFSFLQIIPTYPYMSDINVFATTHFDEATCKYSHTVYSQLFMLMKGKNCINSWTQIIQFFPIFSHFSWGSYSYQLYFCNNWSTLQCTTTFRKFNHLLTLSHSHPICCASLLSPPGETITT